MPDILAMSVAAMPLSRRLRALTTSASSTSRGRPLDQYGHLFPDDLDDVADKMDDLVSGCAHNGLTKEAGQDENMP
jgi:hypothetical protein